MNNFDQNKLMQWFESMKRPLPWRDNPSSYAVWISEVMLQQTQAATVIPYFHRWMEKFPTVEILANASLESVLKCWEGLGYYSRARSLHSGAKYIMDNFNGLLPSKAEDLKKIKGIGPYTLGAIRSFAFKQKAAAVDGNVIRVISRYFCLSEDVSKPKTMKIIWELAERILPDHQPWVFTEALIELGATICGRQARCNECPLKASCGAYLQGNPSHYPYKSNKISIEHLKRAVAVVSHGDHLLVRRGEKGKVMSDLYEFPYEELRDEEQPMDQLSNHLEKNLGLKASISALLDSVAHSFTRFRVQLVPILYECAALQEVVGYQWKTINELKELPFSAGHRRIFEALTASDLEDFN